MKKLLPSNFGSGVDLAEVFKLIWRTNAWMDPLEKKSIIILFTLFYAGLVFFTVNGFNWPQT